MINGVYKTGVNIRQMKKCKNCGAGMQSLDCKFCGSVYEKIKSQSSITRVRASGMGCKITINYDKDTYTESIKVSGMSASGTYSTNAKLDLKVSGMGAKVFIDKRLPIAKQSLEGMGAKVEYI